MAADSLTPIKLLIFVDSKSDEFKNVYHYAAEKHNKDRQNNEYPDSGFDIYFPNDDTNIPYNTTEKIDFKIKCAMYNHQQPLGFYMYPRSSISKTPFRLANNVGIIDSGYRGNIGAYFDVLTYDPGSYNDGGAIIKKQQRLLQICSPTLASFEVQIVDTLEELGQTARGEGGFGSTGK